MLGAGKKAFVKSHHVIHMAARSVHEQLREDNDNKSMNEANDSYRRQGIAC